MSEIGPTSEVAPTAPEPVVDMPIRTSGAPLLYVAGPWFQDTFDPSIDGVGVITRQGTAVPSALADSVIAAGVTSNISIERR